MAVPCKIELVAQLMGLTPTNKTRNEWRYGSKGSLALDLDNDQFEDIVNKHRNHEIWKPGINNKWELINSI